MNDMSSKQYYRSESQVLDVCGYTVRTSAYSVKRVPARLIAHLRANFETSFVIEAK